VQAAGLKPHLAERQIEFVDLNRDELRKVKLKANYSGLGEFWLPTAVLESDFVVSMPKVKTHHWASDRALAGIQRRFAPNRASRRGLQNEVYMPLADTLQRSTHRIC
jgi:hypothetical protein